jgi:hypothetical protein
VRKKKPRNLYRVPIEELLVMCDYLEERGHFIKPIGRPMCYLCGTDEQISALHERLPSKKVRIPLYSNYWAGKWGNERIAFNLEDIKALLEVIRCQPVSHHYRIIYKTY